MWSKRSEPSSTTPWCVLFCLECLVLGCTGSISGNSKLDPGDQVGGGGRNQPASGGNGGHAGSSGQGGGAAGGAAGGSLPGAIGPLPLSRLSRAEYTNTVRWLLRDNTVSPTTGFAPEAGSESGFARAAINVSNKDARDFRDAAESLAAVATKDLPRLTGCPGAEPTDACLTTFVRTFGRRAFRRPLSDAEVAEFVALKKAARTLGVDPAGSVAAVLESMLQSPFFLFKWELGTDKPQREGDVVALTKHQLASRIAFALSARAPDDALIAAVDSGQFETSDDIERVVKRLLTTRSSIAEVYSAFHRAWLEMNKLDAVRKDVTKYPYWDGPMTADLATEFESFISDVLLDGDGKLRTLMTAPHTFVNERVAKIYGMAGVTGANFRKVQLDPTQRQGLLMQAGFLAVTGAESDSLAPRRGDRVWRRLLCGSILTVPMTIPAVAAKIPGQTNRQRFEDGHDNLPCARACHGIIDPPGFAFENFGGAGEYRNVDNGQPVNAAGKFKTPAGKELSFDNAIGMVNQLAELGEFQRCMATHWFRYATGRRELDTEAADIDDLSGRFSASGASIPALISTIVQSRPFRFRAPTEGEVF